MQSKVCFCQNLKELKELYILLPKRFRISDTFVLPFIGLRKPCFGLLPWFGILSRVLDNHLHTMNKNNKIFIWQYPTYSFHHFTRKPRVHNNMYKVTLAYFQINGKAIQGKKSIFCILFYVTGVFYMNSTSLRPTTGSVSTNHSC